MDPVFFKEYMFGGANWRDKRDLWGGANNAKKQNYRGGAVGLTHGG